VCSYLAFVELTQNKKSEGFWHLGKVFVLLDELKTCFYGRSN